MISPRPRLAIVVSHPIQHFVSFYRSLAAQPDLDVRVFYMSDFSVRGYFDREMHSEVAWKMDLVSGYAHEFLPEAGRIKRASPLTLNNPSIADRLARFAPVAVLTYGYNQITQMRVLSWCRNRRIPVMMLSDSAANQERGTWRSAAKSALLPVVLARYAAFLTVGDNNEAYLRKFGVPQDRLFRSPFTIDEETYRDARQRRKQLRSSFRARHGIGAHETVLLTVGKLSPRKRPMDVVAAARAVASSHRHLALRFVLAGNGALMPEIQAAVAAEALPVKCLDFVNVDVLPEVYAASDGVLHPAETDPHPLVMSEAACIGLPLIVCDKVGAIGPTDIVRAGENAIVTRCGDIDAIADAIVQLATNPSLKARMAEASLRIFDELDMNRSVGGLKAALRHTLRDDALFATQARPA